MKKLGIIVPYRDREQHLKKFIPHMKNFLNNSIKYELLIVEQTFEKSFNRAKLFNVGFDILKDECDYFCFHDVDLLPVNDKCDYSYVEGVTKLAYEVSQFNFVPRPYDELGGVSMIDKQSFISVNGFRNEYWGWGVEDNDFGLRCKIKNIQFIKREGRYLSLSHTPNGDTNGGLPSSDTLKNRELFNKLTKNLNLLFDDGINTLKYSKIDEINNNNYKLVKVNI